MHPDLPILVHQEPSLVALAALACLVAAGVAIRLLTKVHSSRSGQFWFWMLLTGAAAGATLWAVHLVTALAYRPGATAGYDPLLTVASLVLAIAATWIGFAAAAGNAKRIEARYRRGALPSEVFSRAMDLAVPVAAASTRSSRRRSGPQSRGCVAGNWHPSGIGAAVAQHLHDLEGIDGDRLHIAEPLPHPSEARWRPSARVRAPGPS